jgi:hypothetical protein
LRVSLGAVVELGDVSGGVGLWPIDDEGVASAFGLWGSVQAYELDAAGDVPYGDRVGPNVGVPRAITGHRGDKGDHEAAQSRGFCAAPCKPCARCRKGRVDENDAIGGWCPWGAQTVVAAPNVEGGGGLNQ